MGSFKWRGFLINQGCACRSVYLNCYRRSSKNYYRHTFRDYRLQQWGIINALYGLAGRHFALFICIAVSTWHWPTFLTLFIAHTPPQWPWFDKKTLPLVIGHVNHYWFTPNASGLNLQQLENWKRCSQYQACQGFRHICWTHCTSIPPETSVKALDTALKSRGFFLSQKIWKDKTAFGEYIYIHTIYYNYT